MSGLRGSVPGGLGVVVGVGEVLGGFVGGVGSGGLDDPHGSVVVGGCGDEDVVLPVEGDGQGGDEFVVAVGPGAEAGVRDDVDAFVAVVVVAGGRRVGGCGDGEGAVVELFDLGGSVEAECVVEETHEVVACVGPDLPEVHCGASSCPGWSVGGRGRAPCSWCRWWHGLGWCPGRSCSSFSIGEEGIVMDSVGVHRER